MSKPYPHDLREQLRPLIGNGAGQVSQSEVARRSGVPQPNISAWLSGRRAMPLERQIDIAEACGCEVTIAVKPPRKA